METAKQSAVDYLFSKPMIFATIFSKKKTTKNICLVHFIPFSIVPWLTKFIGSLFQSHSSAATRNQSVEPVASTALLHLMS